MRCNYSRTMMIDDLNWIPMLRQSFYDAAVCPVHTGFGWKRSRFKLQTLGNTHLEMRRAQEDA